MKKYDELECLKIIKKITIKYNNYFKKEYKKRNI